MKKIILFLCLLLFASAVRAENVINGRKYGDLFVQKSVQADGSVLYGLFFDDRRILPLAYQFDYNEKLHLIVMYNNKDVYVLGAFCGEPLLVHHFTERQKVLPKVFYTLREILDKDCYQLEIKADGGTVQGGVFTVVDGCSYQLILELL